MTKPKIQTLAGLYFASLAMIEEAKDKLEQAQRAKARTIKAASKAGLTEMELAEYIVKQDGRRINGPAYP